MRLYSDQDPDYVATPLHFPIPPPFSADSLANRRRAPAPLLTPLSQSLRHDAAERDVPTSIDGGGGGGDNDDDDDDNDNDAARQLSSEASWSASDRDEPLGNECLQRSDQDAARAGDPAVYTHYSTQAQRMMTEQMGWRQGTGLGAQQSGLLEPLQPSLQSGRRGLGFDTHRSQDGSECGARSSAVAGLGYDEAQDAPTNPLGPFRPRRHQIDLQRRVECSQMPSWCPQLCDQSPPEYNSDSIRVGACTEEDSLDYGRYCSAEDVSSLMNLKSMFDTVDSKLFQAARGRANPYERIGKAIFQNRAALKMANLDSVFSLSDNATESGTLVFVDLCGGPGGFSEYLLWKHPNASGFGMTLKGDRDWRLNDFNRSAPTNHFCTHYGEDGTGNVYNQRNIDSLVALVKEASADLGADLVVSDGGFAYEHDYNRQEQLMKRLILCQVLAALKLLRVGGNFACKIFDLYTSFGASMFFVLASSFKDACIIKPISSRPASSERFMVGIGYTGKNEALISFLETVNDRFAELPDTETVLEIFPDSFYPTEYLEYLKRSNTLLVSQQIDALNEIVKYLEDPELLPLDQVRIRKRCLAQWKVPESVSVSTLHSSQQLPRRPGAAAHPSGMSSSTGSLSVTSSGSLAAARKRLPSMPATARSAATRRATALQAPKLPSLRRSAKPLPLPLRTSGAHSSAGATTLPVFPLKKSLPSMSISSGTVSPASTAATAKAAATLAAAAPPPDSPSSTASSHRAAHPSSSSSSSGVAAVRSPTTDPSPRLPAVASSPASTAPRQQTGSDVRAVPARDSQPNHQKLVAQAACADTAIVSSASSSSSTSSTWSTLSSSSSSPLSSATAETNSSAEEEATSTTVKAATPSQAPIRLRLSMASLKKSDILAPVAAQFPSPQLQLSVDDLHSAFLRSSSTSSTTNTPSGNNKIKDQNINKNKDKDSNKNKNSDSESSIGRTVLPNSPHGSKSGQYHKHERSLLTKRKSTSSPATPLVDDQSESALTMPKRVKLKLSVKSLEQTTPEPVTLSKDREPDATLEPSTEALGNKAATPLSAHTSSVPAVSSKPAIILKSSLLGREAGVGGDADRESANTSSTRIVLRTAGVHTHAEARSHSNVASADSATSGEPGEEEYWDEEEEDDEEEEGEYSEEEYGEFDDGDVYSNDDDENDEHMPDHEYDAAVQPAEPPLRTVQRKRRAVQRAKLPAVSLTAKQETALAHTRRELNDILAKLLEEVMKEPLAQPFNEPVQLPDYADVIQYPMDLGTMLKKARSPGQGYSCSQEFKQDLALISKNCRTYCSSRYPGLVPNARKVVSYCRELLSYEPLVRELDDELTSSMSTLYRPASSSSSAASASSARSSAASSLGRGAKSRPRKKRPARPGISLDGVVPRVVGKRKPASKVRSQATLSKMLQQKRRALLNKKSRQNAVPVSTQPTLASASPSTLSTDGGQRSSQQSQQPLPLRRKLRKLGQTD